MKHFQVTLFYGVTKVVSSTIMTSDNISKLRKHYLTMHPSIAKKIKENKKYWIGFKRIR